MPYGYVGDVSDKIKQSKKNNGVLNVNEIADLQTDGSWGGSLELIQSETLSGTSVEFTDFKGYDVHYFEIIDLEWSGGGDTLRARVSNDGGSSYENASVYDGSLRGMQVNSSFDQSNRNNYDAFDRIVQNDQNSPYHAEIYMFSALQSSDYTFLTWQGNSNTPDIMKFVFGSQVYKVTETINAIKFYTTSYSMTGTINFYGWKEI